MPEPQAGQTGSILAPLDSSAHGSDRGLLLAGGLEPCSVSMTLGAGAGVAGKEVETGCFQSRKREYHLFLKNLLSLFGQSQNPCSYLPEFCKASFFTRFLPSFNFASSSEPLKYSCLVLLKCRSCQVTSLLKIKIVTGLSVALKKSPEISAGPCSPPAPEWLTLPQACAHSAPGPSLNTNSYFVPLILTLPFPCSLSSVTCLTSGRESLLSELCPPTAISIPWCAYMSSMGTGTLLTTLSPTS